MYNFFIPPSSRFSKILTPSPADPGVDKPAGAAGAARRQLQVSQAGHGLSQSGHYFLERNLLTRVAKTLPGTQTHAKQMVSD